ncbi:MAG: hypothetical protein LBV07_02620 [Syntrophobacterales bacterium]|jgi:hypothetical protein|nr:hypothetical protein [Syntrophobacterales bacterium]
MKKKTEKAKTDEAKSDHFVNFMDDFQALWRGFFAEQIRTFHEGTSSLFSAKSKKEFHDLYRKVIHDKIHHFLRNMAVGPLREYQEKGSRLGEAWEKWEQSCQDFFTLLSVPVEEAWKELEREWAAGETKGKETLSPDAIFSRWIEILEGHYMALYQSEEFVSAMNRALQRSADLIKARIALEDDFRKYHHLPTLQEMDELYKDLYSLRKRVEFLEKAQKRKGKSHGAP